MSGAGRSKGHVRRLALAWIVFAVPAPGVRAAEHESVQLLADPTLASGLQVIDPRDPAAVQGRLQSDAASGEAAWQLAQWNSRATLAGSQPDRMPDGSLRFANAAKAVTLGPPSGESRGVRLLMRGSHEYQGRLRRPEEPWPHLLVEQSLARQPSIDELSSLRFHIECRLLAADVKTSEALQPWHCAQFQAFLIVQDCNAVSPGRGDFLWFGIPIYDSRYRQPVAHAARDSAGSRKFIYTPAGSVYSDQATGDGRWLTIDRDLLPLVREGLRRAWREGFMTRSKDLADLRITRLNLGWELTGPLDVEMHFRDLSLDARGKGTGTVASAVLLVPPWLAPRSQSPFPANLSLSY